MRSGRLQAGDPARGVARRSGLGGLAQLEGVGIVLGVIDGDQVAAGPGEAEVQRAGLGSRRSRRHDHDPHPVRPNGQHRRRDRRRVVGFQQQKGPPAGLAGSRSRQPGDQLTDHLGLVVQGGQDGVARPARRIDRSGGAGRPPRLSRIVAIRQTARTTKPIWVPRIIQPSPAPPNDHAAR
jgi:hypothetical protein